MPLVGCGTGGFARALAASTGARVVGLDAAAAFLERARSSGGDVEWVEGQADALPFRDCSFDRVLLSLVLHQLADPERAVGEAFRVLRPGGRVVVRTIAPEDAAERVPGRFVPAMAVADAARMPPVAAVAGWLDAAGFVAVELTRRLRSAPLELADEERSLRADAARYDAVGEAELAEGLQRLRAAAAAAGDGWIDPRPTWFVTATRASCPPEPRPSEPRL